MKSLRRATVAVACLALAVLVTNSVARAKVEVSTGIRYVIANAPPEECGNKAKTALSAYLQNPTESATGSGDWTASGPNGAAKPTAMAAVRCYPVGKGYEVTFTCAIQAPENPYSADDLCKNIAHNFSGKAVTVLATAAPPEKGCTAKNLAGVWTSGNTKLTFNADGTLTDQDGVSGNWLLYGDTVNLTYYGNKSLKVSPDGKHMGDFTRNC